MLDVYGTVSFAISTSIDSETPEEALLKVIEILNNYNINISTLSLPTNTKIHNVEVHDLNITWEQVIE